MAVVGGAGGPSHQVSCSGTRLRKRVRFTPRANGAIDHDSLTRPRDEDANAAKGRTRSVLLKNKIELHLLLHGYDKRGEPAGASERLPSSQSQARTECAPSYAHTYTPSRRTR